MTITVDAWGIAILILLFVGQDLTGLLFKTGLLIYLSCFHLFLLSHSLSVVLNRLPGSFILSINSFVEDKYKPITSRGQTVVSGE